MATTERAWEYLQNASLFKATVEVYEASWSIWFWPVIFLFTLFFLYIKTESPAYIVVYAILGNVALAVFLPAATHTIFYITIVFSLALTLWSFIGSSKVD